MEGTLAGLSGIDLLLRRVPVVRQPQIVTAFSGSSQGIRIALLLQRGARHESS